MIRIYKSIVIILILGLFAHCSSTVEKKIESIKEIAPCQFLTNVNNKFSFRDSVYEVLIISTENPQNIHLITNNLTKTKLEAFEIKTTKNLLPKKFIDSIIIKNNIKEHILIKNIQFDSLEKILLNYSEDKEVRAIASCYNPRHCIYFFNSQKEVLHYFEICFECEQTRSDNSDELSIECYSQFEHLKKFFKQCGIKEGLEKN